MPTREELLEAARRAVSREPEDPPAPQVPEGHQFVGLIVADKVLQLDASMEIDLEGIANGQPVALVHNGDGTWTALAIPAGHKWQLRPTGPVKTLWLPKGSS